MASLKALIVFMACSLALAAAAPAPIFFGHKSHKHVIVHVPYNVHTVHHHHVEKVPIYKEIPIVKHVPIYKEVHVPIVKEVPVPVHYHHEPEYKGWSASDAGWW